MVGDQRVRGRDSASLSDPDAKPAKEKLRRRDRQAAKTGEDAPYRYRGGHHGAPARPVGEIGERKTQNRIEEGEGEAADRAEFGVSEIEVRLDRLGENAEDLPVEEVEDVGEEKQGQHDARR